MSAPAIPLEGRASTWREIAEVLSRPQPVTIPIVALFAIIPFYLYIGSVVSHGVVHVPEVALDRAFPVQPAWSLVYVSLFLAALLPVFVVHQPELVRRTVLAFLFAWLFSYACFLAYPTLGPRPDKLAGEGFPVWLLKQIYAADVRYNCLPSLHVAQCFLAAFAANRVHRGVGAIAGVWASLVAISTLFTKQHYVLDVAGGMALASIAYLLFLRTYPRDAIPAREQRLAPALAGCAVGLYGAIVGILWLAYMLGGGRTF